MVIVSQDTYTEKVKMKEIRNKYLIMRLCYELDIVFNRIAGFDPQFKFNGEMKSSHYSIYSEKFSGTSSHYNVEFRFDIIYAKDYKVLNREELCSDLTDEQLCRIADERRDICCVYVNYVRVRPQGQGIGTRLVGAFLRRIKEINKIKKIYLFPESQRAKRFWSSMGFRDINISDLDDKLYPDSYHIQMVYDLNNG
jgi:GNAT superfamily N-acetyltransferase